MEENKNIPPDNIPLKRKKRSLINRVFYILNLLAVVCLGISYLSPYVSAENFWFIAFFGLGYPLLVIVNLGFVLYWLIQWNKKLFISLVVILCGWSQLRTFFQLHLNNSISTASKTAEPIKVFSYNVRVFDLYNWSHNKETRNGIFDMITDEAPDIMCFQEFYDDDGNRFETLDTIIKFQKAKNFHTGYTTTVNGLQHFGIATFTKYPIVSKGTIELNTKTNNICIYTDVIINKDTVRIYNMHLQSIQFHPKDYKFIDDLASHKETDEELEKSKSILKRLKRAFIRRSAQAEIIAEHIKNCPYKVIVCGDFNDTPSSYVYHTLSSNLKDAFIESGNGFGRSYIGIFPSFRIDYILHSDCYKSYEFRTIREELSDHYPVVCYLQKE